MNTNESKGVLAVLDDAAACGPSIHCTNPRTGEIHSHELRKARAAVAELVEAHRSLHRFVTDFHNGRFGAHGYAVVKLAAEHMAASAAALARIVGAA